MTITCTLNDDPVDPFVLLFEVLEKIGYGGGDRSEDEPTTLPARRQRHRDHWQTALVTHGHFWKKHSSEISHEHWNRIFFKT